MVLKNYRTLANTQTWDGTAWTNNTGSNLAPVTRTTSLCAGNQDIAFSASGNSVVTATWDSSASAWITQSSVPYGQTWGSTGGGGNSS